MKITVITCPFGDLPPLALGAVEKLFYQLAGVWSDEGHDVCFICAGGGVAERMRYVRLKRYKRTGRTLTDLPIDLWYSIKAVLAMPRCDVLVCNTFWSPVLAPLLRWKYKKLVYGVHRYPKGQFGLYRFVHAFICVSTVIGEAVRAQCASAAQKVKIICNPVDTSVFYPCSKGGGCKSTAVTVVYSGRIVKEKGIVNLAKAVRQLSDDNSLLKGRKLRLVLVGPWESAAGGGGESYRDELLAIYPETIFVGPVYEPQKIADYIRSADVYCYPTIAEHGEAMPVAPLEAMACGVPVVLPRFKCFADYAQDYENCMMYESPVELSVVLTSLISDPDDGRRIAIRAMSSVGAFSIAKVAERYLSCFDLLIRDCNG
ncbi:MAG: glycosyltransferase family 4 protein [Lentisphaerae bacterium]|nr:glycosyltransferase family 4 protein [Lentisphaerota bacterium]